jgi:hypothetical protein
MATEYEKKYGNEMSGLEMLEDAQYTAETCSADPCMNCGACEHCKEEGLF